MSWSALHQETRKTCVGECKQDLLYGWSWTNVGIECVHTRQWSCVTFKLKVRKEAVRPLGPFACSEQPVGPRVQE